MRSGHTPSQAPAIDPTWKIGIVFSSFYTEEIGALVEGAKEALVAAGVDPAHITEHAAAGSFEIPLIGSILASEGKVDALIALGIIVEGETQHARLLATEVARGIMDVQLQYQIPFAFEVLYVNSLEQAKARSSGADNKGAEAAHAVLHSLAEIRKLRS